MTEQEMDAILDNEFRKYGIDLKDPERGQLGLRFAVTQAMQEVSRLATLEERERAAKICDENWNGVTIKDGLFGAGIAKASREIATAIRSQPDGGG